MKQRWLLNTAWVTGISCIVLFIVALFIYLDRDAGHPTRLSNVSSTTSANSDIASGSPESAIDCDLSFVAEDLQQPYVGASGVEQTALYIDQYSFSRPTWVVVRKDLAPHSSMSVPPTPGPIVLTSLFQAGTATDTSVIYNPPVPGGDYMIQLYADNGDKKFDTADRLCAPPPIELSPGDYFSFGYDSYKIVVLTKTILFDPGGI